MALIPNVGVGCLRLVNSMMILTTTMFSTHFVHDETSRKDINGSLNKIQRERERRENRRHRIQCVLLKMALKYMSVLLSL